MEKTWHHLAFWGLTVAVVALAMVIRLAWPQVALVMLAAAQSVLILLRCLFGFVGHVAATALAATRKLPLAWYLLAALAAVPTCVRIPRAAVLPFMTAYCMCALFVCEGRKQRPAGIPLQLGAALFAEVKIQVPSARHAKSCI